MNTLKGDRPFIDPEVIARATLAPDTIIVVPVDGKETPIRVQDIGRIASMLSELEWAGWVQLAHDHWVRGCPDCESPAVTDSITHTTGGHAPDCRMKALLDKVRHG